MSDEQAFPVKKAFLYALIVSECLSAVLGILAILSGRFGWFEIRIILTTVTIAASSICGLACGAYMATKREQILPLAGIVLTLLAAAMIIAGMWIELESEGYWKLAASASVFSVACAHLALLSMARLAKWFQWSLVVAHVVIFGVASLLVIMILAEPREKGMFQLLGVAAIIDAAITVLVPIFHWLSRAKVMTGGSALPTTKRESTDAEIARLWTLGRMLVCLLAGLIGGVVLAVVGLVVGATYGGNYATDFQFNGLRGYEATGLLGEILGFVAGAPLCALLVCFLTKRHG